MNTAAPHERVTAEEVRKALRPIGRIPRVAHTVFAIFLIGCSIVPLLDSGDARGLLFIGPPVFVWGVLAFRVRVHLVDEDHLLMGSYLRSTRVRFDEVDEFFDDAYEGWWNQYAGSDGWTNLGLRMMMIGLTDGRDIDRPETIMRRVHMEKVVRLLNLWVVQRTQLSEHPS